MHPAIRYMKPHIFILLLASYLLIVISSHEFDSVFGLVLAQTLFMSLTNPANLFKDFPVLGIASMVSFAGICILFYQMIKHPRTPLYKNRIYAIGLWMMLGALIAFRINHNLLIEFRASVFYFLPELIFYCLWIYLIKEIFLPGRIRRFAAKQE